LSSTSNLISVTTWFILASLRFFFFFPRILIGEYSGIYYPRLLSLSLTSFSSSPFSNPYLDPASSTLLASLVYALFFDFGFDLDPAILGPLRPSNWEKFLTSCFSVSRYLLSRYIVLALFTAVLFCTILAPFTFPIFLDIYSISHHTVLTTLFLSHPHTHTYAKCTSFRVYHPSSLTLYLNPTLSSLFFSSFEGNDYSTSRLCVSLLSFPIFIIYLHHPYYFKFRLSRCCPRPLPFFTIFLLFSLT